MSRRREEETSAEMKRNVSDPVREGLRVYTPFLVGADRIDNHLEMK